MSECYACVCVREFPLQALLRLRPELRDRACVIMEGDPPLEEVCSLNRNGRLLGLARGMTKVEVETFTDVAVLKRSPLEEAVVRKTLLECAGGFSPRVEECSKDGVFLCVIDIAGTETLFGPVDALVDSLLSQINKLGFNAGIASSCNFHTAVVAAKGLAEDESVKVIAPGLERHALAELPLSILDLTEEQSETFSLWGIRTIGMLADLPEKGLIARMGQTGKRLHELAQGTWHHLFHAVEPEFSLSECMEFDWPVEDLNALLFAVNSMLGRLILRATTRALALASVQIILKLEGGATHIRMVRPALPTNDRQLWLKLLHLELEANPPQAAIISVTLDADPAQTSKVQLGLFSPQLPEPSRLDVTLARIRSIVGEENVGSPALKDSHEPDAFRMEAFKLSSVSTAMPSFDSLPPAQRKIRSAETIAITTMEERPVAFYFKDRKYTVERTYGPWVSSGEWWKPTLWGCEQWDLVAHSQEGAMLCCCVVRDVLRNQWKIVSLYD